MVSSSEVGDAVSEERSRTGCRRRTSARSRGPPAHRRGEHQSETGLVADGPVPGSFGGVRDHEVDGLPSITFGALEEFSAVPFTERAARGDGGDGDRLRGGLGRRGLRARIVSAVAGFRGPASSGAATSEERLACAARSMASSCWDGVLLCRCSARRASTSTAARSPRPRPPGTAMICHRRFCTSVSREDSPHCFGVGGATCAGPGGTPGPVTDAAESQGRRVGVPDDGAPEDAADSGTIRDGDAPGDDDAAPADAAAADRAVGSQTYQPARAIGHHRPHGGGRADRRPVERPHGQHGRIRSHPEPTSVASRTLSSSSGAGRAPVDRIVGPGSPGGSRATSR